ncbi:hypothetical protein SAY87_029519 [Trapa incisa]|uniref:Holliday junction resolvase MOC1, chloroplastic n=1 Tax=Trapa incisa TaxID=236973 RepID=A0AAN7KEU0_9MYRT|nr:hypothetical protein SAY87_029519 [Trapa incisa]
MESLWVRPWSHHTQLMNHICFRHVTKLPLMSLHSRSLFRSFCITLNSTQTTAESQVLGNDVVNGSRTLRSRERTRDKSFDAQLKQNWLNSLSCPFPVDGGSVGYDSLALDWVLGIDPDTSGAVAILKPNLSDYTAEVFDSPSLPVLVGKRVRRRLDAKSIYQLLKSLEAPLGTRAYIEQSTPFPQDGKQGWWSSGFGYGLWIGILLASGFSVIPVPSKRWKNGLELSQSRSTKDYSRLLASKLFPTLSTQLKRKKDHGRAEALLIAAYGQGIKVDADLLSLPTE